jgi:hypothetical protein
MIAALLPIIGSVLDRIIPDKNGADKAKQEIETALIKNATELNIAQAETNKIEAAHRSIWVAGWRPCSRLGRCIRLCLGILITTHCSVDYFTNRESNSLT